MMVSSAAMANVRRIHRYKMQKQKDGKGKNGAKRKGKEAQDLKGFPFIVFLASFLIGSRRVCSISTLRFSC